ncbi:UNVERIFIED_ORG: DNA anti-recombination protein RmuC [Shinella zoogloeoides]|nr:DNA anti-recombination protein RmuC [Shinella zoogloeoides]
MTDISQELMFELVKRIQSDLTTFKDGQRDMRQDIVSLRNHMHVMQGDVNNLHSSMAQVLTRLDRIENRLELRELAEAQARFEPHP